ncbi:DUF305 domain-containing protein [Sandarakinorhabdus sp.]|uniref:DUF305 domain-containing protein n=1 Tax=Sandarakinorhabdus sp. TaxID=1916663 RepID=UPI00286DC5E1|nr:DUF305 domain-containing protein [Sandarakinorhabdus sp.]
MRNYLTFAALLIAAPLAAQTPPPTDHGAMSGMNHDAMSKPVTPMPAMDPAKMQAMDHGKMATMDHAKMGGMCGMGGMSMMKNTPANPYAEAGMVMHHKMMVVGSDASETWVRQMIEHHRGAIAMSKIAVVQATDKEARTLAQKDITMQEKDIASLQSWLKRHGKQAQ